MNFGNTLRQLTPLVLLGIGVVALLGQHFPGAAWVGEHLGQGFLLGFCVFLLSLYVLLLWGESLRLHGMLTAVLKAMQDFRQARPGGESSEVQRKTRLEAVRLLIPALSSADQKVRESGHGNLVRLVGKDLGQGPAAWQSWLAGQATDGAGASSEGR